MKRERQSEGRREMREGGRSVEEGETKRGKEGNERGRGVEEGERILLILPLSKLPEKR